MMNMLHLLWIVPLAVMAGVCITALVTMGKEE